MIRRLQALITTLKRDSLMQAIILFGVSILSGVFPVWGIVGTLILLLGVACLRFLERRQLEQLNEWERALRQPDRFAAEHLTLSNEEFLVFNSAVEVLPHSTLRTRTRLGRLGWDPEQVKISYAPQEFDASELLGRVGGKRDLDPPNGIKYCLVDRSLGATDTDLSLTLRHTDYFTIQSVRPLVESTPALRAELGSFDPANNKVPHSLCLHYVVRFANGDVLITFNDKRKAYAASTWSCSGEEQIKDADLESEHPLLTLFRRALLEEVFALSDEAVPLNERWALVSDLVSSTRLWSLFLEEQLCNFSLLGVCQMACNPARLAERYRQIVGRGTGTRDLEGQLFTIGQDEMERLLVDGDGSVTGVFSRKAVSVHAQNLHATSRYRMFRLLRGVKGTPLQPSGL